MKLFENGKLRCPKEKKLRDILEYGRMGVVKEFETELNTILRCVCGHIFSPAGYQEINNNDK